MRLSVANLIELNMAMLFLGTSGPFGKAIDLPVPLTLAIRAVLGLVLLWAYCLWRKVPMRVARKDLFAVLCTGLLMCVHWVTYFMALQRSNVAIGMLSLFTYPVMTALLEPLFLKSPFQKMHVVLALVVLCGVYFLAPDLEWGATHTIAIGLGLLSALVYALRNIILKTKVSAYDGAMLMGYQMAVVGVLLLPALWMFDLGAVAGQWQGILGLVLITTVLGHSLFINTFRHFSITTISILSCIQPIYGIIIGALLLGEVPGWNTVLGGTLILAAVVLGATRSYRSRPV